MTNAADKSIGVFGEVLFDHLPDGRRVLGGAPFNVAWHLAAFGMAPDFISRVGPDAAGSEVRGAMSDWGMALDGLQTDETLPTGRVDVTLDASGDASYDIVDNCAYDAIATAPARRYSLLYHGSLAVRHATSAASLERLRQLGHDTVFMDVNLRTPHWTRDAVLALVRGADWVKLNADELQMLAPGAGGSGDKARRLLDTCELRGMVVTSGAEGAELLLATGASVTVAPRKRTTVVDTIGAGDAFSAVLVMGLILQWPLQDMMERCQDFAGSIVERAGATVGERDFYSHFAAKWRLHG
ncbi:MAG: hypothetical protein KDI17_18610 [Halioglobus sp.]|nr:hypothetical protein [Halioglobus sp.]